MNETDKHLYVGSSSVGNIAEALDAAIALAKKSIPTDTVKWHLVSLDGLNGGFTEVNSISVTIRATPPTS